MRFRIAVLKKLPAEEAAEVIKGGQIEGNEIEFDDGTGIRILNRIRGLGDVIAAVAKPIARGIDAVIGTDLQNCGGCEQRQESLNKLFPFAR